MVCLLGGLLLAGGSRAAEAAAGTPHFTYVLVHGATGGGWGFKEVDRLLTADGHKVYRPTLTGLGEKVHLASPAINLTTHITDIVNLILWEDLHDVVLVGHSYGGMVITGVMDRVPERIKHVIFLDALVPNDGESCDAAWGYQPSAAEAALDFIPLDHRVPTRVPHAVPQPARTYRESVTFRNPAALKLPATYILTYDKGTKPEADDFYRFYERARTRGWALLMLEGPHTAHRSQPAEVAALLEKAVTGK